MTINHIALGRKWHFRGLFRDIKPVPNRRKGTGFAC